jgi:hypothetical protein
MDHVQNMAYEAGVPVEVLYRYPKLLEKLALLKECEEFIDNMIDHHTLMGECINNFVVRNDEPDKNKPPFSTLYSDKIPKFESQEEYDTYMTYLQNYMLCNIGGAHGGMTYGAYKHRHKTISTHYPKFHDDRNTRLMLHHNVYSGMLKNSKDKKEEDKNADPGPLDEKALIRYRELTPELQEHYNKGSMTIIQHKTLKIYSHFLPAHYPERMVDAIIIDIKQEVPHYFLDGLEEHTTTQSWGFFVLRKQYGLVIYHIDKSRRSLDEFKRYAMEVTTLLQQETGRITSYSYANILHPDFLDLEDIANAYKLS